MLSLKHVQLNVETNRSQITQISQMAICDIRAICGFSVLFDYRILALIRFDKARSAKMAKTAKRAL